MIHSPRFIAVLDACVLYPVPIRDLLLSLAAAGLFKPEWSALIQDEWSRNLLATNPIPFAYYCYNNGVGAVSPGGVVTFDNVSRQVWDRDQAVPDTQLQLGKAMEQVSLEDFTRK